MIFKNNFLALYLERQVKQGQILKKSEVAESLKMSRSTLDNWLSGVVERYDQPVLIRICDYFQIPLSELLVYEPEKDNET